MFPQNLEAKTVDPILLYLIIGLIVSIKIALAFWVDVAYFFNPLYTSTYHNLQWFATILSFIFLYYYVVKVKSQRLFLVAVIVIVLSNLYAVGYSTIWSFIDRFFAYGEYEEDKIRLSFLLQNIPSYIAYIMELIIAVQLVKNTIEGEIGKAVKYLGIAFMIEVAAVILFSSPAMLYVGNDNFLLVCKVLAFVCLLPYVSMVYLYALELKTQGK